MSIADNFLSPMGLIEISMKLVMPDHYVCISTQKGKTSWQPEDLLKFNKKRMRKLNMRKKNKNLSDYKEKALNIRKP